VIPTVDGTTLRLSCTDIDARPLFWNEGSIRCGYEPEAAHAVGEALGVTIQWVYTPWDERWPAVLNGEADAVWCGMAITAERAAVMKFSNPYATFNESLLVRRGAAMKGPEATAGMRIGVPAHSTNEQLARSWPGALVVPYAGYDDVFTAMIDDLASGALDGFVDDQPALVPLAERDERFEIGFNVDTRHPWAAAMRPGAHELAAFINTGIAAALKSGSLAHHWAQHLGFLEFPLASNTN
jgi:polar amino acid transport system substrate-binding protein